MVVHAVRQKLIQRSIFIFGLASIRSSPRCFPVAFSKSITNQPLRIRNYYKSGEMRSCLQDQKQIIIPPTTNTSRTFATGTGDGDGDGGMDSGSTSVSMKADHSNSYSNSNSNVDNETNTDTEAARKIKALSAKSQEFRELSLEQRLDLVNGILSNIDILGEDKMYQHDTAVLKLGPKPKPSSFDGNGSKKDDDEYKCSSAVNKSKSLNKFLFNYYVVTCLKSIQKNLKYQIQRTKKKPALLRKVRHESVGGKKFRIHGPVEVWPILHKMEVWADGDKDDEDEEEVRVPLVSSKQSPTSSDDDKNEDGVCVVLGGGNQSIVTFADALQCLFYHPRKPILIKHHPLRPHLYDTCSKLFATLIDAGYMEQVYDEGLSQTTDILQHPSVQHVHVTGAYSTALAIEKTLSESRPHLSKSDIESMITSELGCATPWIFVPGTYTRRELYMAAKHVVTSKKLNAGCNCLCGQVVILPQQWDQKDEFRTILSQMFERIPTDPLYYPGSKNKVLDIVSQYEEERVTQVSCDCIERNVDGVFEMSSNVDEEDFIQPYIVECGTYGEAGYNDFALKNEAFGPLIAIMELPQDTHDSKSYLCDTAVPFVNDEENIFGSLSCSIISPRHYDRNNLREAIAKLNYGSIGLNTWTSYGYAAAAQGGTWGGSIHDLSGQSGRGNIGNFYDIPNVIKTVVWSRSLTFPLIVDKTFIPPSFVTELAVKAYLRWGKFGIWKTS